MFSSWFCRGKRRRSCAVLLVLALLASGHALADAPVPPGEPLLLPPPSPVPPGELNQSRIKKQGSLQVVGSCLSSDGAALPGVMVEAVTNDDTVVGRAVCGADGSFRISGLAPGHYTLSARLDGFATKAQSLTLVPGAASNLTFSFAGPLPPGEFQSLPASEAVPHWSSDGTPVYKTISLDRSKFSDDLALGSWLSAKANEGWALLAVIPETAGTSAFVFSQSLGSDCLVVAELWPIDIERLQERLKLSKSRRLAGVHRLGPDAAALVLCRG